MKSIYKLTATRIDKNNKFVIEESFFTSENKAKESMYCNVITLSKDKKEPIHLGDIFYFITVDNSCSYIDSTKDDLEGIDSGYCFKTEQDCNEYLKTLIIQNK